jgi:hypothetical protein
MFKDPDVISGLDAAIGDANPNALPPIVAAIAAGAKDVKSVPADSIEVIKQRTRILMQQIGDWSIWPEQNAFNADTDDFSLLPRTTKPANVSVSRPWLRSDGPVKQHIVLTDVARQIVIRFLCVRELVGHGIATMRWVSTARDIAGIFTKALAATVFNPMRCVIIGKDRSSIYYYISPGRREWVMYFQAIVCTHTCTRSMLRVE